MRKDKPLTKAEIRDITRRRAASKKRALAYADSISPEEEERIIAAAKSDPDNPPMTDAQLARMRPAHEVDPDLVARYIRRKAGRPKAAVTKQLVSIRLDPDVIRHYRSQGPGWQTRINAVLRRQMARAAHPKT